MNAIILGAGIGAIILCVLWTLALIFCFISIRTRYNIGPIAVCVAVLVTCILLSVPRKSDVIEIIAVEKILDPLFVWRTSVLLFLGLCAISSVGFVLMSNIMEIKRAKPIKSWYIKT